jgi:peroxiredoxin Q/BCP
VRRIAQLRERHGTFRDAGAEIVAILCQKRAAVRAWLERNPLPFPLLADEDRSAAKRWGVWVRLNLESVNIARPASFVVDAQGIVSYAAVSRVQFDVPALDDLLAAIRSTAD